MRLGHLALPGLTSYQRAAQIQEALIQKHLRSKDHPGASKANGAGDLSTLSSPLPTVITAEFQPVYTFGRRQQDSVHDEQRRYLEEHGKAIVLQAQRGGQVTYHGPGQLVAYPIIDLRRHKIRPRDYVRLLEETVISVCSRFGVPNVETTEDPGVWIKGGQRKICAVGVHIQRGITGHGIGLNVVDRDHSLSSGFSQIVACGLEGKQVTWLSREEADSTLEPDVESVASEFVQGIAARLGGIQEIFRASEESLLASPQTNGRNGLSTTDHIK